MPQHTCTHMPNLGGRRPSCAVLAVCVSHRHLGHPAASPCQHCCRRRHMTSTQACACACVCVRVRAYVCVRARTGVRVGIIIAWLRRWCPCRPACVCAEGRGKAQPGSVTNARVRFGSFHFPGRGGWGLIPRAGEADSHSPTQNRQLSSAGALKGAFTR